MLRSFCPSDNRVPISIGEMVPSRYYSTGIPILHYYYLEEMRNVTGTVPVCLNVATNWTLSVAERDGVPRKDLLLKICV
jgi:hypothetical protein